MNVIIGIGGAVGNLRFDYMNFNLCVHIWSFGNLIVLIISLGNWSRGYVNRLIPTLSLNQLDCIFSADNHSSRDTALIHVRKCWIR